MKQRGLLLDRDGVVNEDAGYVGTWDRFVFKPGLFPFLRRAQDRGYRPAIVTNQSGIARGYYTREDYEDLTRRMRAALAAEGVAIDLVLPCFAYPQSYWRKPNPGLILEAALRLNLDLARSVLVGDQPSDIEAAAQAGVGTSFLLGAPDTPDFESVGF